METRRHSRRDPPSAREAPWQIAYARAVSPADSARHWTLDPNVSFLNHGSFGACPIPVLEAQAELRRRLEHEPVRFFVRELEPLLDEARAALAAFVGAAPEGVVFVPNATHGVAAVLGSLVLSPGDQLVTTDHAYNACKNALDHAAARAGAEVVVARVPFPIDDASQVVDTVLAAVGPRTRFAVLDHVTSPTALVLPIERLVRELARRGVDVLVDGAHAPGMLPLSLDALGAAYYTGNCHKWLCAPKGVGFLHARADRRATLRPAVLSHGANSPRRDRSRYWLEFDWTGTADPTAALCVPHALRFMGSLLPGGWPALMAANRDKALGARRVLCDALGEPTPCPEAMIGSMAAVPLADGAGPTSAPPFIAPLQEVLFERGIEVPIVPWPAPPKRLVRVSAQLYVRDEQYAALAAALRELAPRA